jgi:hypothetical protein
MKRSSGSLDVLTSVAVSVNVSLPHGSATFFSSASPSDPQIPFLELNFSKFKSTYALRADYESFTSATTLSSFEANEIRRDGQISKVRLGSTVSALFKRLEL